MTTDPRSREAATAIEMMRRRVHGDLDGVRELFASDARIYLPGTFPVHSGLLTVDEYLSRSLATVAAGPNRLRIGGVLSDGPWVAMEMQSRMPVSNGRTYENQYFVLYKVVDGRVEIRKEYHDTAHYADTFRETVMMDGPPSDRADNFFNISDVIEL